ncbi:MAG: hypothetical protein HY855_04345 [Burkholderiales bacterium]|nr:hypothetical protein [Burkholderiales bacterium]
MGLRLRTVAVPRGQAWLRQGLATFLKRPLGFTSLFIGYLLITTVLGALPFIGPVLAAATMPLLSLAFMQATRDVCAGQPVRMATLWAVWRAPAPERRTLLLLSLGFGVVMTLGIELLFWLGGEALVLALKPLAQPQVSPQELLAVVGSAPVAAFVNGITMLAALLSVPYWHALALVHWGGQSAAQALFSSTLALWRTKGAFTVYLLSWLGCALVGSLAAGLATALLAALVGAGPLALMLGVLLLVALSCGFYVSLWFMFTDTFGADDSVAP